jgi:hypothetical protein
MGIGGQVPPDLSQAPAAQQGNGSTQLVSPRYIVVLDEFASRDEMMCYKSEKLLSGEPYEDEQTREDRRIAYSNAAGTMKGQLSRRVVEINAWGFVLRERVWQFNEATGEATVATNGLGEDYIYQSVGSLFPSVAQAASAYGSQDKDIERATRDYASELLLTEKRTFSHAVAASRGEGGALGLIEFTEYARVDGDGTPAADQLRRIPWSSRVRPVGSGLRQGTDGTKVYRQQTFYEAAAPWSVTGQITFNRPVTARLAQMPELVIGTNQEPDAPGELTRHDIKYLQADIDNPLMQPGQWRL